jgi:hypothetical protein
MNQTTQTDDIILNIDLNYDEELLEKNQKILDFCYCLCFFILTIILLSITFS